MFSVFIAVLFVVTTAITGFSSGSTEWSLNPGFVKVADNADADFSAESFPPDSAYDGRIWTNKSVTATSLERLDANGAVDTDKSLYADAGSFLVALEALGEVAEKTEVITPSRMVNVCLVLDMSNSMNNNFITGTNTTRLELLRTVAADFVGTLADITTFDKFEINVNLSVVVYGSYGQVLLPWTALTKGVVEENVKGVVSSMQNLGATNTQEGLYLANYMFYNTSRSTNTTTHPESVNLKMGEENTLNYTLFMGDGSANVYHTSIDSASFTNSGGYYRLPNYNNTGNTGSYAYTLAAAKAAYDQLEKISEIEDMTVFSLGLGDAFVGEESEMAPAHRTFMRFMKLAAAIGNDLATYSSGNTDYTIIENNIMGANCNSETAQTGGMNSLSGVYSGTAYNYGSAEMIKQYYAGNTAETFQKAMNDIRDVIAAQTQNLQSLTYVTESTNVGGYVEFSDKIGKDMKVYDIVALRFNGSSCYGDKFAAAAIQYLDSGIKKDESLEFDYDELSEALHYRISGLRHLEAGGTEVDCLDSLLSSSRAGGSLYRNSDFDFSNVLVWYADAAGVYIDNYYDMTGGAKAAPANAAYKMETYIVTHDVEEGITLTDNANLIYVTSAVETSLETGDQRVIFGVPSSCLPYKHITQDAEGLGVIDDTPPIGLLYKVGVNTDSLKALSGSEGSVSLNTNLWSADGDPDSNTIVTYTPSTKNAFYYVQEDTLLYIESGGSYVPATSAYTEGTTYYIKETGYNAEDSDYEVYRAVGFDGQTDEGDKFGDLYLFLDEDGFLYEKKGAPKLWSQSLDTTEKVSGDNISETYGYIRNPSGIDVEATGNGGYLVNATMILGNNGRLTFNTHDLDVSKKWINASGSHDGETVYAAVSATPYYMAEISVSTPFNLSTGNGYTATVDTSDIQDLRWVEDILGSYEFYAASGYYFDGDGEKIVLSDDDLSGITVTPDSDDHTLTVSGGGVSGTDAYVILLDALSVSGTPVEGNVMSTDTIALTKADNWTYSFENIPVITSGYMDHIVYSVTETDVTDAFGSTFADYTPSYGGDGFNTLTISNTGVSQENGYFSFYTYFSYTEPWKYTFLAQSKGAVPQLSSTNGEVYIYVTDDDDFVADYDSIVANGKRYSALTRSETYGDVTYYGVDFDSEITTQMLGWHFYVMFVIKDEDTTYCSIRDRIMTNGVDGTLEKMIAANSIIIVGQEEELPLKKDICEAMVAMYNANKYRRTAVLDSETDGVTYSGIDSTALNLTGKRSTSISVSDPWGLRLEATIDGVSATDGSVRSYGAIIYNCKNGSLEGLYSRDNAPMTDQLLALPGVQVFDYSHDDADNHLTVDKITIKYNTGLLSNELDTDILVAFYYVDGNGIMHAEKPAFRNMADQINAQIGSLSGNDKTVAETIYQLYAATQAYRAFLGI